MDIELALKLLASAVGVVGTLKLIYDWAASPRGRMREHYNFARDFLQELESNPNMHPYLVESGFQAVAGTRSITADEARYIIGLEPAITLSDYVFARPLLHVIDTGEGLMPAFRIAHAGDRRRFWRKMVYLTIYFVAAVTPVWLFVLGAAQVVPRREGLQLAIAACGLWPLAFLAMLEGARISRAELIVERGRTVGPQGQRAKETRLETEVDERASGPAEAAIRSVKEFVLHEPATAR